LSAPAVAKEARIDSKSVTNMLNAKHNPNLDNVEAVARVFGLTSWQLIRHNFEADAPTAEQIDGLIQRFYDSDAEHRRTIMQVAEMAGQYKAK
jgi:transcriptional regulator with XRE-family HTH domain